MNEISATTPRYHFLKTHGTHSHTRTHAHSQAIVMPPDHRAAGTVNRVTPGSCANERAAAQKDARNDKQKILIKYCYPLRERAQRSSNFNWCALQT